ncbi:hypothetical protein [Actinoplanes sp. NPDC051494]|uniref:hypothetical protein n=1 Tax=Actinoplanes sp. NPDC051494 TaxID=3363907 RepID=UPI0037A03E5F
MSVTGLESVVTGHDGVPLAILRHRKRISRSRFEILDPTGATLLATGAQATVFGTKYELMGPQSQFLMQVKFGWSGASGRGTVSLPDGRTLGTKGSLTGRDFAIFDEAGSPVGALRTTSKLFTLKRAGLEFELSLPMVTVVQAIGLAEFLRTAAENVTAAAA